VVEPAAISPRVRDAAPFSDRGRHGEIVSISDNVDRSSSHVSWDKSVPTGESIGLSYPARATTSLDPKGNQRNAFSIDG